MGGPTWPNANDAQSCGHELPSNALPGPLPRLPAPAGTRKRGHSRSFTGRARRVRLAHRIRTDRHLRGNPAGWDNRDRQQSRQALPDSSAHRSREHPDGEALGVDEIDLEPGTKLHYFGDYELVRKWAGAAWGWSTRPADQPQSPGGVEDAQAGILASDDDAAVSERGRGGGALDHPHIVPIFEVGEHQASSYFSMKLMAGGAWTRAGRLRRRPEGRRAAGETAAEAVHHAHQRGSCIAT